MPNSAAISRSVLSDDGAGGRLTTWTTVTASVDCRLTKVSLRDVQRLAGSQAYSELTERIDVAKMVRVVFPAGTDVRNDDRITVSSISYQVMDVNSALSHEVHRETLVTPL
jgi:hypothetical protein